ncbi:MAG: hypothetical protein R8K20_00285 [Gallionellaceae bacterium]
MTALKSTNDIEQLIADVATSHPPKPIMICEGDSWFAYPSQPIPFGHRGSNVIDHIEDTKRYHILRMEYGGDEAAYMLCQSQRHKLDEILCKMKHMAKTKKDNRFMPSYILFSGGGNDIVGAHDVVHFLNEYKEGMGLNECFREKRYQIRLNQIKAAYLELIAFRDDFCPDAHILTHCYDLLIPTGKAAWFFGVIKVGAWLRPFIEDDVDKGGKGIKDPTLQQDIVNKMLTLFKEMLSDLAIQHPNFHLVDTFGAVGADNWTNEIHPDKNGFKLVANRFLTKLNEIENN